MAEHAPPAEADAEARAEAEAKAGTGTDSGDTDRVAVVYALPDEQVIVTLPFRDGMTAEEAVAASRLTARFPEIASRPLVLGIFGLRVELTKTLEPGDRVEICRPLLADPRDMRRDLLAGGRVMGGRAGDDSS